MLLVLIMLLVFVVLVLLVFVVITTLIGIKWASSSDNGVVKIESMSKFRPVKKVRPELTTLIFSHGFSSCPTSGAVVMYEEEP